MSDLLCYCQDHNEAVISLLNTLIEYETYTIDKPAVDEFATFMIGQLEELGATVERLPRELVGDCLLAKWNAEAPGKPITYVGHLDTVWPAGTLAERPVRVEDGLLYGPGSIDMKAGLAVMVSTIKNLRALGEFPDRPVWALLTSDEEKGSPYSKDLIMDVARQSALCVVIEPATPQGAIKTWRKGVANFTVRAIGKSSHAGGAPEEGINAVVELAHQAIKIDSLQDMPNGTSVSVTVFNGGHTTNVIPDSAELYVDVRFLKPEEADRIQAAMANLTPVLPGAGLEVDATDMRPPMVRDEQMCATYRQIASLAESVGVTVAEDGSGGGSDGNYTSSVGTPTIDGMGPVGAGLHAIHENVVLGSIPNTVAMHMAILKGWE